jgi:hypothetical protein
MKYRKENPSNEVQAKPKKAKNISKSLADLSQTVAKNSENIKALSALPEVIKEQTAILKTLMDAVHPNNNEEIDSNMDNDDPVALFMSDVLENDQTRNSGKAIGYRYKIIIISM